MNTEIEQLFFDICNLEKKKYEIIKIVNVATIFMTIFRNTLKLLKKIHDKINKIIYSKDWRSTRILN